MRCEQASDVVSPVARAVDACWTVDINSEYRITHATKETATKETLAADLHSSNRLIQKRYRIRERTKRETDPNT